MPSAQINQPSNQIKLTNVSMVRLKKGKKRFEIACYKNTVQSYRAGHETDLDNVLQIPNVFLNVSKGQVAPNDEIVKAFGKGVSRDEIIMEILQKGELQVGEKERAQELERVHREVVEIVAGRLVDPKTKRVYTTGMVEKALEQLQSQSGGGASSGRQAGSKGQQQGAGEDRSQSRDQQSGTSTPSKQQAADGGAEGGDAKPAYKPKWTGVSTNKSAKSQALEAMKALIAHQPIPVARARMRLRITCPTSILKQSVKLAPKNEGDEPEKGTVKDKILSYVEQVETQDVMGEEWECVGFVEPGSFKTLGEFINTQTKGRAVAEVLDMAVTQEEK
jgi:ribosome maturation protein SDO1